MEPPLGSNIQSAPLAPTDALAGAQALVDAYLKERDRVALADALARRLECAMAERERVALKKSKLELKARFAIARGDKVETGSANPSLCFLALLQHAREVEAARAQLHALDEAIGRLERLLPAATPEGADIADTPTSGERDTTMHAQLADATAMRKKICEHRLCGAWRSHTKFFHSSVHSGGV